MDGHGCLLRCLDGVVQRVLERHAVPLRSMAQYGEEEACRTVHQAQPSGTVVTEQGTAPHSSCCHLQIGWAMERPRPAAAHLHRPHAQVAVLLQQLVAALRVCESGGNSIAFSACTWRHVPCAVLPAVLSLHAHMRAQQQTGARRQQPTLSSLSTICTTCSGEVGCSIFSTSTFTCSANVLLGRVQALRRVRTAWANQAAQVIEWAGPVCGVMGAAAVWHQCCPQPTGTKPQPSMPAAARVKASQFPDGRAG